MGCRRDKWGGKTCTNTVHEHLVGSPRLEVEGDAEDAVMHPDADPGQRADFVGSCEKFLPGLLATPKMDINFFFGFPGDVGRRGNANVVSEPESEIHLEGGDEMEAGW